MKYRGYTETASLDHIDITRVEAFIDLLAKGFFVGASKYADSSLQEGASMGPLRPTPRSTNKITPIRILSCRGQGRLSAAVRHDIGHGMCSVGSRELCQPRTEADGPPSRRATRVFARPRK